MSDLLKNAAPELYEALRDLVNAGHPDGMRLPAYRRAEELLRRLLPVEQMYRICPEHGAVLPVRRTVIQSDGCRAGHHLVDVCPKCGAEVEP